MSERGLGGESNFGRQMSDSVKLRQGLCAVRCTFAAMIFALTIGTPKIQKILQEDDKTADIEALA